jgi:hypothetical protein
MAKRTTFSKEEPRGTSVTATQGGGQGSTIPSACGDTGFGTREIDPTIRYVRRPDVTSEVEVEALGRVYHFVIRACESRQATETADRDKGEEVAERDRTGGTVAEGAEASQAQRPKV